MPKRILRDLTDSERYNVVSVNARDTFVRLLNKADDFGIYFADARRLRPLLYPLLLAQVREADLQRWIAECEKSVLVRLYTVGGREYLQISLWRERLRAKKSNFPFPPWGPGPHPDDGRLPDVCQSHDGHMTVTCPPEAQAHSEAHSEAQAPKTARAFEAERQSDARTSAQCWCAAERPDLLRHFDDLAALTLECGSQANALQESEPYLGDRKFKNPFGYALAKVRGRRQDGAGTNGQPPPPRQPRTKRVEVFPS